MNIQEDFEKAEAALAHIKAEAEKLGGTVETDAKTVESEVKANWPIFGAVLFIVLVIGIVLGHVFS